MNAMPAFSSRSGSCGSSVRISIEGWSSRASISAEVAPPSSSARLSRDRTAASCTTCVRSVGPRSPPRGRRPPAARHRGDRRAARPVPSPRRPRPRSRPRPPTIGDLLDLSGSLVDRLGVAAGEAEVERGRVASSVGAHQDEHRQHRERDRRRDHEALVAKAHREVPGGHDPPRPRSVRRGSCERRSFTRPPPRGTAPRAWGAPDRTARRRPTPWRDRADVARRRRLRAGRRARRTSRPRAPHPGSTRASHRHRRAPRPGTGAALRARSSSIVPSATARPPTMSTTESQSRSTRSS